MVTLRFLASIGVLTLGSLVLGACGGDEAEPPSELAVEDQSPPLEPGEDGLPPPAGAGDPVDPVAGLAAPDPAPERAGDPVVEVLQLTDWYFAVLIDENAIGDPRELEAIGRSICEGFAPCRAAFWYDRATMPTGMPVGDIELRTQAFAFGRTLDGSDNMGWGCLIHPELDGELPCLPRPMN